MCFGVGDFGCGSGCVHVVAPPRRSFLIVRVAFFPVWVEVARFSSSGCGYWCGGLVLCVPRFLRVYGGNVVV